MYRYEIYNTYIFFLIHTIFDSSFDGLNYRRHSREEWKKKKKRDRMLETTIYYNNANSLVRCTYCYRNDQLLIPYAPCVWIYVFPSLASQWKILLQTSTYKSTNYIQKKRIFSNFFPFFFHFPFIFGIEFYTRLRVIYIFFFLHRVFRVNLLCRVRALEIHIYKKKTRCSCGQWFRYYGILHTLSAAAVKRTEYKKKVVILFFLFWHWIQFGIRTIVSSTEQWE